MLVNAEQEPMPLRPAFSGHSKRPVWTECELSILRAMYPNEGAHVVVKMTRRPYDAVHKKAQDLGVRRSGWRRMNGTKSSRPWTAAEETALTERYLQEGAEALALALDRTPMQVQQKAHKLGITRGRPAGRLRLPIGTVRDRGRGARRSPRTEVRVANTGHRPTDWKSIEEVDWVQKNGPVPEGFILVKPRGTKNGAGVTLVKREEFPMHAAVMHATPEERELFVLKSKFGQAIARLERASGPSETTKSGQVWSPAEIQYLHANHATQTARQIGQALGRSIKGVLHQLKAQGWNHPPGPRWTADDLQILVNLYPISTDASLAKRLSRSPVSIARRAKRLGLQKRQKP